MSSRYGENFRIQIFGESHGAALGVTIEGIPPGFSVDHAAVALELARRAPGGGELSTARRELDIYEVVSGEFNGHATGTPFTALIRNTDVRSRDYEKTANLPRPGHADYTGAARYRGYQDIRGGGHFSARLTAPLVIAGAIARQMLAQRGVTVGARIVSIGTVCDVNPIDWTPGQIQKLSGLPFPVCDQSLIEPMKEAILAAKNDLDSVGSQLEVAALGLPAGIGSPIFRAVDSVIAQMLFSVPAVKAVEFGDGAALSALRGSAANDPFTMREGKVVTATNHCGGVLGGITTGMPLTARVSLKPTPSIARQQHTVDMAAKTDTLLEIQGRHDPCVALRAVPVVESAVCIALADVWADTETWEEQA